MKLCRLVDLVLFVACRPGELGALSVECLPSSGRKHIGGALEVRRPLDGEL